MAQGDITFFEEALDDAFFNGWASADTIKCAIITNGTVPTAADATPALGDYTEVATSGTYTAGGYDIGTWGGNSVEAGGTLTFDSATNPVLTATASNGADAYYGVLYNDTQTGDPAFAFVDLGGPIDGTASTLTINWNASGIFTIS